MICTEVFPFLVSHCCEVPDMKDMLGMQNATMACRPSMVDKQVVRRFGA